MIPDFNLEGALPPFLAGREPTDPSAVAPYLISPEQLVQRFAYNNERRNILKGFFKYREALKSSGIIDGFQWINGSFVEDCETIRESPPGDIDIVTFAQRPIRYQAQADWQRFINNNVDAIFSPLETKANFMCDAYFVDLDLKPEAVVKQAVYWFGLFSHMRDTGLWKGLLEIPLNLDDQSALTMLNGGLPNASKT